MSLKTFVNRILGELKKAFSRMKPEIKKAVAIGVLVVDNIRKFVDSPIADVITTLIPGDVDDKVKILLREHLPKVFAEMKLVEQCGQLTDPNEIVFCGIRTLQQISGDWLKDGARKNFYDSLAVLLAQVAADGKLDWDDAKLIEKWYYDNKHNKTE